MDMVVIEVIAILVLLVLGLSLVLVPDKAGAKISGFYSKYPVLRYAGSSQFKLRSAYVRAVGIVFLGLGALGVAVLVLR